MSGYPTAVDILLTCILRRLNSDSYLHEVLGGVLGGNAFCLVREQVQGGPKELSVCGGYLVMS